MSGINFRQLSVPLTMADAVVIGNNDHRTALCLYGADVARFSVCFGEVAVLNKGFTYFEGAAPVIITRDMFGDGIAAPVHIIGEGAGLASIVEVSNPCCRRKAGA